MPEPKRFSRWNPFAAATSSVDDTRTYWFEILFVAVVLFFGVSRWLEQRAENEKRREYVAGIRTDLDEEIATNQLNLNDCRRDIWLLRRILSLSDSPAQPGADSIPLNYQNVYVRGVFREFARLTYDLMVTNGDLNLIRNLPLRQALTGTSSFRNGNLKTAFTAYDAEVKRSAESFGQFVDLYALLGDAQRVPFDQAGFRQRGRNAVFQLLRAAQVKAFYLEISTENLQELKKTLANSTATE